MPEHSAKRPGSRDVFGHPADLAVLHAPNSSSSMTVLAVRQTATSAPALVAIPR
ncbi:MAG: hypothetical protein HYZ29_28040 [Myxococcales bacterium]|nr:hypothetical protein [Myxococcales bacterium]